MIDESRGSSENAVVRGLELGLAALRRIDALHRYAIAGAGFRRVGRVRRDRPRRYPVTRARGACDTMVVRTGMPANVTHDFVLLQGRRAHDTAFIAVAHRAGPTWHGRHLMRSALEARWAAYFESRGYRQADRGLATPPCYFYEPRGMRRWPGYPAGRHYRVDFVLVDAVETVVVDGESRSRAARWTWISVKPAFDPVDLEHLRQLRRFDSRHSRAFQCVGDPANPRVYEARLDGDDCNHRDRDVHERGGGHDRGHDGDDA